MHGEPIDGVLLRLLSDEPGPWRPAELKREFEEQTELKDALERLVTVGFVHRMKGGFYAASAAGRYADEIGEN
jgi:DNA-binding HxlR family transcriptional regulator